ncbi:MAG: glycoside hydrolase family 3 protein [Planctomycetota bacterium]|jgi:beta-N-acetylhexosaminidase
MARSRKPARVRSEKDIGRVIRSMTLDQKVGQCMTLGFYGTVVDDKVAERIAKYHAGGLRITPHVNTSGNPDKIRRLAPYLTVGQYAEVLNELQRMAADRPLGLPLHMVTDQEGDLSVDILHGGMNLFPSQMGLAATGSLALTRSCALAVARQLRAMGVHMVHSPVLDVNNNPRNPEIGCRSFSNCPQACVRYGEAFMKGLQAGGIIATGKHFPGRGDSTVDAHYTLPVLKASRKRLDAVELWPYRQLIPKGLPAVMTAHNAYPALDESGLPASISPRIVTGLLRGGLGFDGVITTDAMYMKGLTSICPTPEGCARAIAAGNDRVLVKGGADQPRDCHAAIKNWVKRGRISADRLNDAVFRILRIKLKYRIFAKRQVRPALAEKTVRDPGVRRLARTSARRCIAVIRDRARLLPLSPKRKVLVIVPWRQEYHQKGNDNDYAPEQLYREVRRHCPAAALLEFTVPSDAAAVRRAVRRSADFDVTVVMDHVWRGPATSHAIVRKLVKARRRVAVVSNNPYDDRFLPEARTLVVTYSAMPQSMAAAADLLFGKCRPAGVWPLKE